MEKIKLKKIKLIATEKNYFKNSSGTFEKVNYNNIKRDKGIFNHDSLNGDFSNYEQVKRIKKSFFVRKAEKENSISSRYGISKDKKYLLRFSNHWGNGIRSCQWFVKNVVEYDKNMEGPENYKKGFFAKIKFSELKTYKGLWY